MKSIYPRTRVNLAQLGDLFHQRLSLLKFFVCKSMVPRFPSRENNMRVELREIIRLFALQIEPASAPILDGGQKLHIEVGNIFTHLDPERARGHGHSLSFTRDSWFFVELHPKDSFPQSPVGQWLEIHRMWVFCFLPDVCGCFLLRVLSCLELPISFVGFVRLLNVRASWLCCCLCPCFFVCPGSFC